jgi:hypothetical protein
MTVTSSLRRSSVLLDAMAPDDREAVERVLGRCHQKEHIGIERQLCARARQIRTERARQLASYSPAPTSNPRGGKKSKQSLNKK